MNKRAKYKTGDEVAFWFAGSMHSGIIDEVRKDSNKVSYTIKDSFYTYPVSEDKITKKL